MKSFLDCIEKYDMLNPGDRALLAVSGGADSMCLLALMLRYAEALGVQFAAAHFNHRLRGAESDRDEAFVRDFCLRAGVAFYAGSADVAAEAERTGEGTEACARRLRYAFLEETALGAGAGKLATAHTADDNAETVLMHLVRGTGLRGLAGIPPVRGKIVRPLISAARAEIEAYLEENNIPHVEDSTNADDAYTRNRIRRAVVPVLKELNPRFAGAVFSSSELLRADAELLDALAAERLERCMISGDGFRADAGALSGLPAPLKSRALRLLLKKAGAGETARAHIEALGGLLDSGGPSSELCLPGVRARMEYGSLVVSRDAPGPGEFHPRILKIGEKTGIPELGLWIELKKSKKEGKIHKSVNTFYAKSDTIAGEMTVRPRRTGDRLALEGRAGSKSLKKLFIDEKVPAGKRGLIPVIADEAGVIAVAGFGMDRRAAAADGDEIIIIDVRGGKMNE